MTDTASKNSGRAAGVPVTRRGFMETSVSVASGAALAMMPVFSGNMAFAAPAAPATAPDAPAVTFDSYFTGWPVYDFSGAAEPVEPPAERKPGAALAAMSDEEFHRHYMYL